MNDSDPYKHIRALALSISDMEKQMDGGVQVASPVPDAPGVANPVHARAPAAERRPKHEGRPATRNSNRLPDPDVGAFAVQLRAAREHRGLTQRELGGLAGVPQSHISKIESGAVDLRLSSLVALARILDLALVLEPRDPRPAEDAIAMRPTLAAAVLPPPRLASTRAEVREPMQGHATGNVPLADPVLQETGTQ
jgi:transcriptional regulator with XRE-family HTH domain